MAALLPWTMTSVGRDDPARRLKGRNPSVDRKKFRKTAGGASPSPTGRRGNIPRREIGGRPHRAAPTTSPAKNSKAGGRADLLTRPPVLGWVSFHAEDFAPWGEFLSQRWERNQRIAGGDSHRRREQVPSGSSSFSPGPPFTGDTPTPFRRSSGQPWQEMRDGWTPIRPQWPPQAAPNAKPSEAGLRWRGGAME